MEKDPPAVPGVVQADTRREALGAFARALRHEAYVLAEQPQLLWQQLHNRLQWDDAARAALQTPAARECAHRAEPWLSLQTRLPESVALVRVLGDQSSRVLKVVLSPDERLVAVATAAAVSLWEVVTWRQLWSQGHRQYISWENRFQCVFSADSRRLATGLATLSVWDVATGMRSAELNVNEALLRAGSKSWTNTFDLAACTFSPDGRELLSLDVTGTLTIWDAQTWTVRSRRELKRAGSRDTLAQYTSSTFEPCAFSPDATALVAHVTIEASEHNHAFALNLWADVRTQREGILLESGPRIQGCCFSGDGGTLVTIGSRMTLWDTQTWQKRVTEPLGGLCCAASATGGSVVVGDARGTLWVMDFATGRVGAIRGYMGEILACACDASGDLVLSGGADQTVQVWDGQQALRQGLTADLIEQIKQTAQRQLIGWCAFGAGGHTVVSAGGSAPDYWLQGGYTLALWDAATGQRRSVVAEKVKAFALAGTGRALLTAADDTLTLWDVETGTLQHSLRAGFRMRALTTCALSAGGTHVAGAGTEGASFKHARQLNVWMPATQRLKEIAWLPEGGTWFKSCAFSPDGRRIVLTDGHTLWLARSHTHRGRRAIRHGSQQGSLGRCAFSLDGTVILSAGEGSRGSGDTVELWSVGRGRPIATIRARTDGSGGMLPDLATTPWAMSPDGMSVVLKSSMATAPEPSEMGLQSWEAHTGRRRVTFAIWAGQVAGFAYSPDGRLLFVASRDHTLTVWDTATGSRRALLRLPNALTCVAAHPWQPRLAVGHAGGGLYLIELIGISYGPLVVTAVRERHGLWVECPRCAQRIRLTAGRKALGRELACPHPDCGTVLRLNLFVHRLA